ncbi:MAG: hypothetical protein AAGI11_06355 [Pseudomonadota bacterium]
MARTTISIPDQLKARMDTVKAPPNWSGIAARAFERELDRIESVELFKEEGMSETTQRLEASRQKHLAESGETMEEKGRRLGMIWAEKHAEYSELKNLSDSNEVDPDGTTASASGLPIAIRFNPAMSEDDMLLAVEEGRDETRDFWETHAGDYWRIALLDGEADMDALGGSFREGFLDGAFSVWDTYLKVVK